MPEVHFVGEIARINVVGSAVSMSWAIVPGRTIVFPSFSLDSNLFLNAEKVITYGF
jgi:hypothetical protein